MPVTADRFRQVMRSNSAAAGRTWGMSSAEAPSLAASQAASAARPPRSIRTLVSTASRLRPASLQPGMLEVNNVALTGHPGQGHLAEERAAEL